MQTLVAVDGSEQSYEAARALAHLRQSEQVLLLHALDVPEPAYPTMVPEVARDLYTTVAKGMREDGERLLDRVKSILPSGIGPVTTRLEIGKPVEVILTVAEQERIGLIVMGARGVAPIRELVLGSVSHRILTHAVCPTLVVKSPVRTLRRVLLAVQGSEDAEAAARFLTSQPFREPVEITVLTVFPAGQPLWPVGLSDSQTMVQEAKGAANRFVEEVADRLAGLQYCAGVKLALGAPAPAILREADSSKADLILMGTRGRQGIARFFLGSVAHTVLHRAPCPVLVVR